MGKNSVRSPSNQQISKDKQVFVGGCHPKVTESDLQQLFEQFGTIKKIKLMKDKYTRRFRGFAFVIYNEAQEALNALNSTGLSLLGQPVNFLR